VQADVGSRCTTCVRAARPPLTDRIRLRTAGHHDIATRALVAVNVVFFLWLMAGGERGVLTGSGYNERQASMSLFVGPIFDGVDFFDGLAGGEWYRVVTSGFVHFGIIHLAMNMILLWQLGQLLERPLGAPRFVLLYFASLLGGSAGVVLAEPNAITGGASGAVFGLMAASATGMWQRGVNPFQTGIGALLVLNLVITFSIPGVSIGGHLGGAVAGAVVGYRMLEPRWQRSAPALSWLVPIVAMVASLGVIASQVP
jgi:membrane associated rhomboid family serine protease